MAEYTDSLGVRREVSDRRQVEFIYDMLRNAIPWRWYSGRFMFGSYCPAAVVDGIEEMERVIRATAVGRLRQDQFGMGMILYTG